MSGNGSRIQGVIRGDDRTGRATVGPEALKGLLLILLLCTSLPEVIEKSPQNWYSEKAGPDAGCSRHSGGFRSAREHAFALNHFRCNPSVEPAVRTAFMKQAAVRYRYMMTTFKNVLGFRKPNCLCQEIWEKWLAYWSLPEVIEKSEKARLGPGGSSCPLSAAASSAPSLAAEHLTVAAPLSPHQLVPGEHLDQDQHMPLLVSLIHRDAASPQARWRLPEVIAKSEEAPVVLAIADGLPDVTKSKILKVILAKDKLSDDVDFNVIAHMTSCFSGRDLKGTEIRDVTIGYNEIIDLLKGIFVSRTPLTDVILGKRENNSVTPKLERLILLNKTENVAASNSKKMKLEVMVQKSTYKLLFAQADGDFVDFLFSLMTIPLGGVETLLGNSTYVTSIDNLYKSIGGNTYYGEHLSPNPFIGSSSSSPGLSLKSPKGDGNYVKGLSMYMVTDDLTVTPLGVTSSISVLNGLDIMLSDVEEWELDIGMEEGKGTSLFGQLSARRDSNPRHRDS
ncbi:hypothetical protein PHJA_000098500 [Phtheirospermum japonicum]|uniref:Uncharacterized protein n=1 Tax=Phtheirospermum japonicum TaxID=374723 RepID=A0A830AXU0_9LAMI|nr:hypothetical protein PHJA_000098500 [Phtheirospermum japonicum]